MLGMLVLHNCSPHLLKVSLFDEDDTNHMWDTTTRVLLTRGDGEAGEGARRTGQTPADLPTTTLPDTRPSIDGSLES